MTRAPAQSAGGAASRSSWALADQAIYTGTNFALILIVARNCSPDDFGAFSVAYAAGAFIVAIAQALVGETLLVTRRSDSEQSQADISAATGAALIVGAATAPVLALAAVFTASPIQQLLLLLALFLPALLLQDATRVASISQARSDLAAISDTAWAVLQLGGFGVLALAGATAPEWFLGMWGIAAVGAAAVGCWCLRVIPRLGEGLRWAHHHRRLGVSYSIESMAFAASGQLTTVVVAAVGGLAAAGGLRAGQTIYGPVNVVLLMLRLFGISEAARVLPRGIPALRRSLLLLAGAGAAVGATSTLIILALPDDIGTWMFGQTWALATVLLLPLGLQKVAIGVAVGPFSGLRVLRAARLTVILRPAGAVVTLVLAVGGALLYGTSGAAWGLFAGAALSAAAFQSALVLQLRRQAADDDVDVAPGAAAPTDPN